MITLLTIFSNEKPSTQLSPTASEPETQQASVPQESPELQTPKEALDQTKEDSNEDDADKEETKPEPLSPNTVLSESWRWDPDSMEEREIQKSPGSEKYRHKKEQKLLDKQKPSTFGDGAKSPNGGKKKSHKDR